MAGISSIRLVRSDDENPEENPPEIHSENGLDDESGLTELDPDPAPVRRPGRRRSTSVAGVTPVTQATVRKVKADMTGILEILAAMWDFTGDHCCAPILEQQAPEIAEAVSLILKRYPRLMAKFMESDMLSTAIAIGMLGKAIKPVAGSVYTNHIAAPPPTEDTEEINARFPPFVPPVNGVVPRA